MGLGSLFGGSTEFKQPPYSAESRKRLYKLATSTPSAPEREIAEVDPLQQSLYRIASERLSTLGQETPYDQAISSATSLMDVGDPTESDIYKGILQDVSAAGTQSNRNLARALRISGNAPVGSSKGRDIIGRNTTEWQKSMAGALADFVSGERNRQLAATQLQAGLTGQKEDYEAGIKTEAGHAGDFMRAVQQAIADEEYNEAQQLYQWITQTSPGILSSLVGGTYVNEPSALSQVASGIGNIGNIIGGGLSMTGSLASLFKNE